MGFVIRYQIIFPDGGPFGLVPLRISNDVFGGEYVLDADIKVDMLAGAVAASFELAMTDLPQTVAETLIDLQRTGLKAQPPKPLAVTITLGYFDDLNPLSTPVLKGFVQSIRSAVDGNGHLITTVSGAEQAGYRLIKYLAPVDRAGAAQLDDLIGDIATAAGVQMAKGSGLGEVSNLTVTARNAMEAVRQITAFVGAPMVVTDGEIRVGDAVGATPGATFEDGVNVVTLERHQLEVEAPALIVADDPLPSQEEPVQAVIELTVLGDPSLRPGQRVTYTPSDPANAIPGDLRLEQVRHDYLSSRGYTCFTRLLAAEAGKPASRPTGAHGVVQRVLDIAGKATADKPAIDVGEVASYQPGKHLSTLHYGQNPPGDVIAPSVEAAISRQPLLHDKPSIAPFAWHNCGLVVPVYPGMRAVLAHNRSLTNDALVSGYVWAEQANHTPPRNHQGDWWLCLPTELGADGLPTRKGVNDLTDSAGLRVIQASGLRITVGQETLPEVGERPQVPPAGALVVEHGKKTTITVGADGAVTIETDGKDITFSNGKASITLSDDSITLHGASVEVS